MQDPVQLPVQLEHPVLQPPLHVEAQPLPHPEHPPEQVPEQVDAQPLPQPEQPPLHVPEHPEQVPEQVPEQPEQDVQPPVQLPVQDWHSPVHAALQPPDPPCAGAFSAVLTASRSRVRVEAAITASFTAPRFPCVLILENCSVSSVTWTDLA